MRFSRQTKIIIFVSLNLLFLAGAFTAYQVYANTQNKPVAQISQLHPLFPLLDKNNLNVLETGEPVSTMQTCGQCHDTVFIADHSFHSDLGMSEQYTLGTAPSGRPWDTSTGLYGKWNPLSYRILSPSGDSRLDLDEDSWVKYFAGRISGGGPGEKSGLEMNCFLCHLANPNNAARISAIQTGEISWANTATLLGTGIVDQNNGVFKWNIEAFTIDGELDRPFVTIQDPGNDNCAQCHGFVHSDNETLLILSGCSTVNWETATTGQVISGQKISVSGMNLSGKAGLSRSWDIHAERGLECTDCHYSLNNPSYYQSSAEDRPSHLQYDPRRLEIGEYLEKPDHNLARSQSAQNTISSDLKGSIRRCESCHDASTHSDWLPYNERHMQEIACETCHIPQMFAPAVQFYDWTALQSNGQPLTACRGVDGDTGTLTDLVTGFQPVLLQRSNIDGEKMLAPHNLVTAWYWVYDDPNGLRPVRLEDLRAAWFEGAGYAQEVINALDENKDGQLTDLELRLNSLEKQQIIADRLSNLGLTNPHIQGEIQPYSINHNVTRSEWAISDCQLCHTDDSRLAKTMELASYLPGNVLPQFVQDASQQTTGVISNQDGLLVYKPIPAEHGLYIFGHNRVNWIDWLGALLFMGVLMGVVVHGGLRFYISLQQPHHHASMKRVYMYQVYERFWHWLQTFVIVVLLITGLIIHRPDIFGFLSFRYMVTVHNIMAAILVINAALSLFYHLVSGEIKQFIPRPYGFFDQAIIQAKYYLQGIFKGASHPFERTRTKKMNPLQQITYFGILNILLPLQIITGALMWGVQHWPDIAKLLGGLPFLAPFHSLVAWTFGAFIVGHVYLTTTGHEPLALIKAMMDGWEDVEDHEVVIEQVIPQPAPEIELSETSQSTEGPVSLPDNPEILDGAAVEVEIPQSEQLGESTLETESTQLQELGESTVEIEPLQENDMDHG